ncbi:hypothetical protein [Hymenobacter ruricola]|uniref:SGNH/GDSL hydrolase family protein n=1 Tax=Hymenobacter ruricola TaxID=2791023 RepID=A0ABS0I6E6_9BACT|nr:hypothetical protein [Hymenobacter ruricola]MBF9222137.1 hypothetical protein [Hymenobacter ruricola]
MRRFVLFMSLLAILVAGADFALTKLFDALYVRVRTGQTGGEINQYLAMPQTPAMLIMGNSRARYQVDPDSFVVPTYSLCHAGMGQVFQTGLLDVLRLHKKLPPAILLHVDFEEYMDADNTEDVGNLRYYYHKVPSITSEINGISKYERVKYLFQFYRYNGRTINTLKNYLQSINYSYAGNGYQKSPPVLGDTATFRMPAPSPVNPRVHRANLRHLESFIKRCKSNQVKLLCFTSPYLSPHSYAATAARSIDSLLRTQHVPYLNVAAHTPPILMHHAKLWQDGDHLNELGATCLSHELAQWSAPFLRANASAPLATGSH